MAKIIRWQIGDYINITPQEATETYALCGMGFTSLNESPSAETEDTAYINSKTVSTETTRYTPSFAFDMNLMDEDVDTEAVMYIYNLGTRYKLGEEAQTDYVRVEYFKETMAGSGIYEARKFRVSISVDSIEGAGTETITVSGNFNSVKDPIIGEWDESTKTFTEGTATP